MLLFLQKLRKRRTVKSGLGWLATALLGAVFLLSGCARQAQSGVTIQLSTWGSAQEVGVLKQLLHTFEQTHPGVHVALLHIPENYYQLPQH